MGWAGFGSRFRDISYDQNIEEGVAGLLQKYQASCSDRSTNRFKSGSYQIVMSSTIILHFRLRALND